MAPLRVVFMGTAQLSCNSLRALIESPQFQVVAVVTQPDRPKGRDLKLQPSPVKELALQPISPFSSLNAPATRPSSAPSAVCSRTWSRSRRMARFCPSVS